MIFIAFAQLDLLLFRLGSDLIANAVTLNFYLDGKIYDPEMHARRNHNEQIINNNNHNMHKMENEMMIGEAVDCLVSSSSSHAHLNDCKKNRDNMGDDDEESQNNNKNIRKKNLRIISALQATKEEEDEEEMLEIGRTGTDDKVRLLA